MNISLSGINIYTKNPAKSFEFYKGLGWEVTNKGDLNTDWFGAEFKFNNLTVWIWNNKDGSHNIKNNFVIHCDDIFETYNELKSKGYAVPEPKLQFYGDYEMELFDDDENLLLFLS